jgi:hypothetical protein
VDIRHKEWLALVKKRVGLKELDPQPYWGFEDLQQFPVEFATAILSG